VTREMPPPHDPLDCASVDELDAAYALGALDADERRAVDEHLATCPHPHAAFHAMTGVGDLLAAGVTAVDPPPALRDRLMASIASAPQDAVPATTGARRLQPDREVGSVAEVPRGGWFGWLSPRLARGVAGAALLVIVALGAWNVSLQSSVASRDEQLRAVAAAIGGGQVAFRVTGNATGYVVADAAGHANLVVAGLTPPEANRIYELWLIGADGKAVAVGTSNGSTSPVAVVPLERGFGSFTTFAVTIESHRVDAPTSQPVMVAKLGA
jgi:anti-sigma factor RsiW